MALHEHYTREIRDELNYVATWLPTVRLAPGDVCDMRGNALTRVGDLGDFDIAFEPEDRPVESDIEYTSSGAVSISFKLEGEPAPTGSLLTVGEAGISVSFGREGAVVLRMAGCSGRRLPDLHRIGEEVLALHEAGRWPEGYVVVTETVEAGASTIMVAQGRDAGVDLVANGSVGQAGLSLASLDAGLQVKRESRIGAKFVAMPGLTPLVRVSGIRKRFLRPDRFRGATRSPTRSDAGSAFAAVDYDDFPGPDAPAGTPPSD